MQHLLSSVVPSQLAPFAWENPVSNYISVLYYPEPKPNPHIPTSHHHLPPTQPQLLPIPLPPQGAHHVSCLNLPSLSILTKYLSASSLPIPLPSAPPRSRTSTSASLTACGILPLLPHTATVPR